MQERRNPIANTQELSLSCMNLWIYPGTTLKHQQPRYRPVTGDLMFSWIRYHEKRKCRSFHEIFITDCTGSCQNDNFWRRRWCKSHQNEDILRFSVRSVYITLRPIRSSREVGMSVFSAHGDNAPCLLTLSSGRFEWNESKAFFTLTLEVNNWGKGILLVRSLLMCKRLGRQDTSHYLSQCFFWSMPLYGIARPQWVTHNDKYIFYH